MSKPVAFLPPPATAAFAVYTDEEETDGILLVPVDYFVLFDTVSESGPVRGLSIIDGWLESDENFLGYAANRDDAKKLKPEV